MQPKLDRLRGPRRRALQRGRDPRPRPPLLRERAADDRRLSRTSARTTGSSAPGARTTSACSRACPRTRCSPRSSPAARSRSAFHEQRIYSSAIVGGVLPIAVGAAMAIRASGEDARVHCFLGEMTAESGIAHESIKYSRNFGLPIRFVVEDNEKSVCTDTREAWGQPQPELRGRRATATSTTTGTRRSIRTPAPASASSSERRAGPWESGTSTSSSADGIPGRRPAHRLPRPGRGDAGHGDEQHAEGRRPDAR